MIKLNTIIKMCDHPVILIIDLVDHINDHELLLRKMGTIIKILLFGWF